MSTAYQAGPNYPTFPRPVSGPPLPARLRCALCRRTVDSGGHMCVTDSFPRYPEEHLAMCGKCETFHEPHCGEGWEEAAE